MTDRRLSRRALLAAGAGSLALAGCLTAPTTGGPGPTVEVTNDAATPRRVTVSILGGNRTGPEPFGGVRITSADGSERTVNADGLDQIPPEALADAVAFVPEAATTVLAYPDLEPGSTIVDTVPDLPERAWAVYVVAAPGADEPLLGFGQVTCAPDGFLGMTVEMDDDTTNVGVECRG